MGVILLCNREYIQLYRVGTIILLCYRGVHAENGGIMLYFAFQTVYVNTHAVKRRFTCAGIFFLSQGQTCTCTRNIASPIKLTYFLFMWFILSVVEGGGIFFKDKLKFNFLR